MKKLIYIILLLIPSVTFADNLPYNIPDGYYSVSQEYTHTGMFFDDIESGFDEIFLSGSTNIRWDDFGVNIHGEILLPQNVITKFITIGDTNKNGNSFLVSTNKNELIVYLSNGFSSDKNLIGYDSGSIIQLNYSLTNSGDVFELDGLKKDVPISLTVNSIDDFYKLTPISTSIKITLSNNLIKIEGIKETKIFLLLFGNTEKYNNSFEGTGIFSPNGKDLFINKNEGYFYIDGQKITVNPLDIKHEEKSSVINSSVNSSSLPFTDISTSFAKDYIVDLYSKGYVKGYSDNKFKPDQGITRAEFLKIVMSAYGKIDSADLSETGTISNTSNNTSDLSNNSGAVDSGIDGFSDTTGWAVGVAKKAKELGYVNGQNGRFRPNDKVSRAEAIKILINVSGLDTSNYENSTISDTGFNDVTEQWMVKFVAKSKDSGIVSGQNGKFRPNDSITRAEASKIIFNSMK